MRTFGLSVALVLAAAAPAAAQETIYAGPPFMYYTPDVTIDQGGTITFTNVDPIGHDVLATGTAPDGKPWFRSEIVSAGASSDVAGAGRLVAGTYDFVCSIHPSMTGTVTVTSNGTPQPRPGAGGGSPPPAQQGPPAPAADTAAPAVSLSLLDGKVAAVRKRRAVRLRLRASEPATVALELRSGRAVIASATLRVQGTEEVAVRLSARGRRLVRKARRLKLTVSALATDAAGNRASAGASRTLR